jgi:hypothetical protein
MDDDHTPPLKSSVQNYVHVLGSAYWAVNKLYPNWVLFLSKKIIIYRFNCYIILTVTVIRVIHSLYLFSLIMKTFQVWLKKKEPLVGRFRFFSILLDSFRFFSILSSLDSGTETVERTEFFLRKNRENRNRPTVLFEQEPESPKPKLDWLTQMTQMSPSFRRYLVEYMGVVLFSKI